MVCQLESLSRTFDRLSASRWHTHSLNAKAKIRALLEIKDFSRKRLDLSGQVKWSTSVFTVRPVYLQIFKKVDVHTHVVTLRTYAYVAYVQYLRNCACPQVAMVIN